MRPIIGDPRVLNAMCRLSFATFVRPCFHTLFPGTQFKMNGHIRAVAHILEQVRLGRVKRLIINMPPGSLKSFMASSAWPAFVLGHDPTKRIAVVSYGSELAVTLGNNFRHIVNSSWYQQQFPFMPISAMKNTELEIRTTLNGFRLGTTVEGAITGLHADIIIIDDPIKPMDAFSDAKRERVNTWFNKSVLSRVTDPRTGAIIVMMQRLHDDDLSGMLLRSSNDWRHLSLPAIAETEERIPISDHQHYRRHVGDALHPERETFEELLQRRAQVGPETFAAQWQQSPTPASGTIIKREWLRYYDHLPPDSSRSPIFQAWDLASKDGEENDWSVCTTWRYHDRKYFLLDELRDRLQYPFLRDRAISNARSCEVNMVLIEDDMLGNALAKEMEMAGLLVTIVPPQRSKQMRAKIQSAKFRGGRVLLPKEASFLAELETELLAFPKGRFDDRVDSICLALSYELPAYDLEKANPGFEKFVNTLAWQQQFFSRIK